MYRYVFLGPPPLVSPGEAWHSLGYFVPFSLSFLFLFLVRFSPSSMALALIVSRKLTQFSLVISLGAGSQ